MHRVMHHVFGVLLDRWLTRVAAACSQPHPFGLRLIRILTLAPTLALNLTPTLTPTLRQVRDAQLAGCRPVVVPSLLRSSQVRPEA